jgi:hypothetical protein
VDGGWLIVDGSLVFIREKYEEGGGTFTVLP